MTESLKKYICAFNDERHFLTEPIKMDCGHYICKKCSKIKTNGIVKCFTCDKKDRIDFRNLNDKNDMKYEIRANISQLYAALEKQFDKAVNELNSTNAI